MFQMDTKSRNGWLDTFFTHALHTHAHIYIFTCMHVLSIIYQSWTNHGVRHPLLDEGSSLVAWHAHIGQRHVVHWRLRVNN